MPRKRPTSQPSTDATALVPRQGADPAPRTYDPDRALDNVRRRTAEAVEATLSQVRAPRPARSRALPWEVGLQAGSRALSRTLLAWRRASPNPLTRTIQGVLRLGRARLTTQMPGQGSISRYEDPKAQHAINASIRVLATLAHLYGHTMADLGAQLDQAMEPWLLDPVEPEPAAARPLPDGEGRVTTLYRLLPAAEQSQLLGFLEMFVQALGIALPASEVPANARRRAVSVLGDEAHPMIRSVATWALANAAEPPDPDEQTQDGQE